jgi:hypothetical protein
VILAALICGKEEEGGSGGERTIKWGKVTYGLALRCKRRSEESRSTLGRWREPRSWSTSSLQPVSRRLEVRVPWRLSLEYWIEYDASNVGASGRVEELVKAMKEDGDGCDARRKTELRIIGVCRLMRRKDLAVGEEGGNLNPTGRGEAVMHTKE